MAQLKTARMSDATVGNTIDNHMGDLETGLGVILGLPTNTDILVSNFRRAIHRLTSAATIINTTAESDAPMPAITVVGGTLGTDGIIKIDMFARVTTAAAAGTTITFRLKYGATTVCTISVSFLTVTNSPLRIQAHLGGRGATNAQWGFLKLEIDEQASAIGIGAQRMIHALGISEDSTLDKNLSITGQWDTNDDTFERIYAIVERT